MKIQSNRMKTIFLIFFVISFLGACSEEAKERYHCPMHPNYTADRPGTCPICGMDLVKIEQDSSNHKHTDSQMDGMDMGSSEEDHSKMQMATEEEDFYIAPEKSASIGIQTGQVEKRHLIKKVETFGSVAYDPDLYSALQESREAWKTSKDLKKSGLGVDLYGPTVVRLRELGLTSELIRFWSRRNPQTLVSGSNTPRAVIFSESFEKDIQFLNPGMKVEVEVTSFPGKTFYGKLVGPYAKIDSKTRTLRVVSEVSDPSHLLKPQMYATVRFQADLGERPVVPRSAVIFLGEDQVVYLALPESKYRAVSVRLGAEADDYFEVIEGLSVGDKVVVSGNFLLDSEAKLKLGGKSGGHKHSH